MPLALTDSPLAVPRCPRVAVVLGSGLAELASLVQDAVVFNCRNIPGYPPPATEGHGGRIVIGALAGRKVVIIQGRAHLYEGRSPRQATFPLRLAQRLGAQSVVITCGAGGLGLSPGEILFLTDHMRAGPGPSLGAQGCAVPYDTMWTRFAQRAADECGIATTRGTIVWTQGPSYETKAEIRYFMQCGARAVGMSTIPEVLEAKKLGMHVLGLALITNAAAGLGTTLLSHAEVLACGAQMDAVLKRLLPEIVRVAP